MDTVNTAEIKSKIDLRDVAGRLVELRKEKTNGSEMSGPCPKCGGTDRFHCTADWWFCRVCHEKRADVIDFLQFVELASDFRTAVDYLAGWNKGAEPVRSEKRQPERSGGSTTWKDPIWQSDARQFLDTATLRLSLPEGLPCREYLAKRGILPATWEAFGLGYANAWHLRRKKRLPALILSWKRRNLIKALQYRFIGDDITQAERYSQKAGGERTLFGVDLLARRRALILVEGELNAVSIWQVGSGLLDVVSFGPQDNIDRAALYMRAVSSGYQQVIVWADEPDRALHAKEAIGREATAVQSPAGLDANDLLRLGKLDGFLAKLIKPVGSVPPKKSDRISDIKMVYPANASTVTVHGKWRRLEDGRIEAEYSRAELIWAMMATGYQPTAEEMAIAAKL